MATTHTLSSAAQPTKAFSLWQQLRRNKQAFQEYNIYWHRSLLQQKKKIKQMYFLCQVYMKPYRSGSHPRMKDEDEN